MSVEQLVLDSAKGVINQGVRSSNAITCLYRGPNGAKCAIGHLIPDNLYKSSFDCQIDEPVTVGYVGYTYLPSYIKNYIRSEYGLMCWKPVDEFLVKLQRCHDKTTHGEGVEFVEEFKSNVLAICTKYDVNVTKKDLDELTSNQITAIV